MMVSSWCRRQCRTDIPVRPTKQAVPPGSLRHKIAIRMPGVALAVAPLEGFMEAHDGIHLGQVARLFEVIEQVIALRIDIRRDVMSDLPRRLAQADAPVIR